MRSLLASPTVTYCEQALGGLVKRPWSALSNLAFIGVGIYILAVGKGTRLAKLFGITALLVGVLSTLYDITYTYGSQLLDLSGMLVFVSILLYLNIEALLGRRFSPGMLILPLVVSLGVIIWRAGYSGDAVFGVYVLAVIATEVALLRRGLHHSPKLWLAGLGVFALGFGFWLLDSSRTYCLSFGLLNGRAIFHYCGATAMVLLIKFYNKQTDEFPLPGRMVR